jgi:hypothetical protein
VGWGLVFSRGKRVGRIRSGNEVMGGGNDEVGAGDSGFTGAIFTDAGS